MDDDRNDENAHRGSGGSGGSLERLYRLYGDWLRRSLRRRFGADAAEDLVQEAYLRLGRSGRAADLAHPKAFLMRIATNVAVDQGRRAALARRHPPPTEEAQWAGQDEALLLKAIVLGLPEPLRDVFVLSRFAGLSYPEIAERLGLSVKTVEWRMSRALAICVAQLSEPRPDAS